ncbi:MAG: 3-deoxy-8-phosphooctulonate synthase [Syntrophobacterales bacterium]|nr:3-deoxy-8-phosphooctulonate synthase [Syntrophobacterales bacterium]
MLETISSLWDTIWEGKKLTVIAGPCVMESYELMFKIGSILREICKELDVVYIFKSSYDKANRTSIKSFRGPGLSKGLYWLKRLKDELSIPVLTDIHSPEEAEKAGEVCDIIQIPAFLCRQTDIVIAAASTGRIVNVKKGQFMAPWDMEKVVEKVRSQGNTHVMLTERGTTFGYNNLVVDMRSIVIMKDLGVPVIFDATHSIQQPGGLGVCSGGDRRYAPVLARASIAAGADGVFFEVHPEPDRALCDGPNSLVLDQIRVMLEDLVEIFKIIRKN